MKEQQNAKAKGISFQYCKFTLIDMDNGKHVHIKVQMSQENANLFQIWENVSPVLTNRRNRRQY